MSKSKHDVAIFEEGFILVRVSEDDVINRGAPKVWKLVQNHPWIVEQEIPVAIVYEAASGMQVYGDNEIVEAVTEMDFDEITWGHELTLEW